MKKVFDLCGCILVRNFLSEEELTHIMGSLTSDEFRKHNYGVDDGDGRKAHMTMWRHPGNDISGMLARSEKVVNTCEHLMGGEVYHYHSKLMGKPPREGGRHMCHQDYGYWYENDCLFPDMITVFMAMDKCEKINGCLQYLPGSNRCGRIEHHRAGGQFEADIGRVEKIKKVCPLQYAEMQPGDALFMHCNVLHCSSANTSEFRRWALLCCYNKATNNPVKVHHLPQYTPLLKVKDEEILKCARAVDMEGKSFIQLGVNKLSLLEPVN